MCSNCNRSCGGRGAIAYQNDGCGCGNNDTNNCGCANAVNNCGENDRRNCGCGCGIIDSLAKGFACTTNRIVRGLDRSLSSCGGYNNGCGCGNNGCGC